MLGKNKRESAQLDNILSSYHSDDDEKLRDRSPSPVEDDDIEIKESIHIEGITAGSVRKEREKPSNSSHQRSYKYNRDTFGSEISDWNEETGETEEIIRQASKKQKPQHQPSQMIPSSESDHDWQETDEIPIRMQNGKSKTNMHQPSEAYEIYDLNRSMYTEKIKQKVEAIQPKAQPSPAQRNSREKQPQRVQKYGGQDDELLEVSQSVHMNAEEKPVQKKSHEIEFKMMDKRIYWKESEESLEITYELIQMLTEEFLKEGILLPLVEPAQLEGEFTPFFMEKFTEFMLRVYFKEFKTIFQRLKKSMDRSSLRSSSSLKSLQSANSYELNLKGIFKFIESSLMKKNRYSKTEILRRSLVQKLESLKIAEHILSSLNTKKDLLYEKELTKIKEQIGSLDLLICIENAECYCKGKMNQEIQQKIWNQRAKKVTEKRKQWVAYLTRETGQEGCFCI